MCFAYNLDHDRRITFSCWFLFLPVGVPCRVLLLAPCFHLVVHHRLPLCYSSLPCVASFCSVGFFLLAFSPCFAMLCPWPLVILLALLRSFHLVCPLSLFLSCPSLRSLGGPPVPSWPSVVSLASASLWVLAREVLSSCLGLQILVFGGSWLSPSCFLVGPRCFPFFPLGVSCAVGVPCMPFASLLSLRSLAALCVVCGPCSFFLLSLFHGYLARPASVSPRPCSLFISPLAPFRSLSRPLFALTRGVFSSASSSSSSALSSSSVPFASGPPGMSAVAASSMFACTASLSSILAAASWFSFWFSPLAIFLLCYSPLSVV